MKKYFWTNEQIEMLRREYPNTRIRTSEIAEMIGFPREAVVTKARNLGIKRGRNLLTEKEINYVLEKYPNVETSTLAKEVGVRNGYIQKLASDKGIRKSAELLSQLSRKNKGGQFQKGIIPHNKGKKMPLEVYEKVKRTMFKKGNLPNNTKFDGAITERFHRGKFDCYYIRISLAKWIPLSHYIWQQNGFELPTSKEVIRFIDGNARNYAIENLEKITRRENRIRNTYYFRYAHRKDIIKAIRAVAGVRKRITHIKRKINESYKNEN